MKKKECYKCHKEISLNNIEKHEKSCDGNQKDKLKRGFCRHCKEQFDIDDKPKGWMANHSRWCLSNPLRKEYSNKNYLNAISAMNNSRKTTGITNQFTKAEVLGIEKPESKLKGQPGGFKGKKHSEATKEKMRLSALNSSHRRLRRNIIIYKGISLDSSWELSLAKRLDELNINWTRPDPMPWFDEKDYRHNYFPDFYLIDYNLYVDPKNPAAIDNQRQKIDILLKTYKNLLFLADNNLCETFDHTFLNLRGIVYNI